ncbi:hypothetical protein HY988_05195 [Candidatus Micrarchaeota archaeon]|nr:hypothetical protein [Candidatus Micrarchaeota archaeon]
MTKKMKGAQPDPPALRVVTGTRDGMVDRIGQIIADRYRVLEIVNRPGAKSIVYQAQDIEDPNRIVAIKEVNSDV